MDDKHEIVSDLKRVAAELGRVPNRDEYRELGRFSDRKVRTHFGAYTILLRAAGYEPTQDRAPAKLKSAEFFKADLAETIKAYHPPVRHRSNTDFKDTLYIPDLHAPWVSEDVLCAIYERADTLVRRGTPYRRVVQLGDARDRYADSKFPKSHLIYTPEQEDALATEVLSKMWATLQRILPGDCEYYALLGNHDIRPYLRVAERAPDQLQFFNWDKFYSLYEFPGVKLIRDPREPLILDNVAHIHGYAAGNGKHRDFLNQSVVHGHTHKAAITVRALVDRTIVELDCGLAGDFRAKCMNFTPMKTTGWTLSFGEWDRYGPRFILV